MDKDYASSLKFLVYLLVIPDKDVKEVSVRYKWSVTWMSNKGDKKEWSSNTFNNHFSSSYIGYGSVIEPTPPNRAVLEIETLISELLVTYKTGTSASTTHTS